MLDEIGYPTCPKCKRNILRGQAFIPATFRGGGGCLECVPRNGCGRCPLTGPHCGICYMAWQLERQQYGLNVWKQERRDHQRKLEAQGSKNSRFGSFE